VTDGEIRYLQTPAADIEVSAGRLRRRVFGWGIRTNTDGERAFVDSGRTRKRHLGARTGEPLLSSHT
jgi:hypothetical protein